MFLIVISCALKANAQDYLITFAVTDLRNLCPTGWHIPSDDEWTILENYLISNGYNYDGTITGNKYAKALADSSFWMYSINSGAVGNTDYPTYRNKSGFTAPPGGRRFSGGSFDYVGRYGYLWSSSNFSTLLAN